MPKINLTLKTLTPMINLSNNSSKIFVKKKNRIYIIDIRKLDKVLSFMCLLGEFNDYMISSQKTNITDWLADKKLLKEEFLLQISANIFESNLQEPINSIKAFVQSYDNLPLLFGNFCKENMFNLLVFEYLSNNSERINKYVNKMLCFLKEKDKKENEVYSFEFFIKCLFEVEKEKIYKEICLDNNFNVCCKSDNYFENFYIENIFYNSQTSCYECLKEGSYLDFEIHYYKDNSFLSNAEKYFEIAKKLSFLKFSEERKKLTKIYTESAGQEKENILNANISSLNINQIFYLCLSKENKKLINELFPYKFEDFIFYYQKSDNNNLKFLNYAEIC